jgi:hypothetical protein
LNRIIYLDLNLIEVSEIHPPVDPDPELVLNVNRALAKLDPLLQDILKGRYYDGETIDALAVRYGISGKEIKRLVYEAVRQMRFHLGEFVRKRWGIDAGDTCRVCAHPLRGQIEEILRDRKPAESWRIVTEKIRKATGERFHPPQILKAHINHTAREEVPVDE